MRKGGGGAESQESDSSLGEGEGVGRVATDVQGGGGALVQCPSEVAVTGMGRGGL